MTPAATHMPAALFITVALAILPGVLRAGEPVATTQPPPAIADTTNELPKASFIMEALRRSLPPEPLTLKGQLQCGTRIGRLEKAYYIDVTLELGKTPPSATYLLRDHFGGPLEQLTVIHPAGALAQLTYQKGNPLQAATLPDLAQPIAGTDVTWNDLSLSFCWWPNGRTVGQEDVRGRMCYVIEFSPAPTGSKNDTLSVVRLWIDQQLFILLKMEEYNAEGKLMRRMSVKNFKKISDIWMIKNMEVRTTPSRHRTVIHIDEVRIPGVETNAASMKDAGEDLFTDPAGLTQTNSPAKKDTNAEE